jgi:hypothetical protein
MNFYLFWVQYAQLPSSSLERHTLQRHFFLLFTFCELKIISAALLFVLRPLIGKTLHMLCNNANQALKNYDTSGSY